MSTTVTTNSPVTVYVKFTESGANTNIEYFTDANGSTKWQPASLPANSQTKYTFKQANHSDRFGWYALTFWPEDGSEIESNVVESFLYQCSGKTAQYEGVSYVKHINLAGGSTYPNFCVYNNGSGDVASVGVELTICDQSSKRYFTSRDPEITLAKEGTGT